MKGRSNIVAGIHHLKMAFDHFEDFGREHPGTKGSRLFEGYNNRLKWIMNDLATHPLLPEDVRNGVKEEVNSDVFAIPAIAEKISLLSPANRESLEEALDLLLSGEEITISTLQENQNVKK